MNKLNIPIIYTNIDNPLNNNNCIEYYTTLDNNSIFKLRDINDRIFGIVIFKSHNIHE
jgi:hypothetical protein